MRKTIAFILVVLVAVMTVAAFPVRFIFADLNQHTELLAGFLPTYTLIGAGFDFSGDSENTSELQTLVGGGFTQRRVWQDPKTGLVNLDLNKKDDGRIMGITYDVIQSDLMLRYIQGMFDDKLTFRFGLEGKFEKNQDSFKKDKNKSLDEFLGSEEDGIYKYDIYPDLTGNKMSLGAILNLRIKYDIMDDTLVTSDGFTLGSEISIKEGPRSASELSFKPAIRFITSSIPLRSISTSVISGIILLIRAFIALM